MDTSLLRSGNHLSGDLLKSSLSNRRALRGSGFEQFVVRVDDVYEGMLVKNFQGDGNCESSQ